MKHFSQILLFTFLIFSMYSTAQTEWLGKRISNTSAFLDPTEIQMSGSINGLLDQNMLENQYIPFSIGAYQSIFSKQLKENKAWEIIAELGVFTQFQWTTIENEQQRNLLNTDYKIAFSYVRKIKRSTYRIRFYHVSSHLGDDYIIRNGINKYTENKVNYEQLEFTFFQSLWKNTRVYGGLGSVVRPNSKRLPFSFHLGSQSSTKKEDKKWAWTYGFNLKAFQETDFNPSLKLGFGPAYYSTNKVEPLRIVLEYYNGQLPYSQYESEKIEWLGLGLYFYI